MARSVMREETSAVRGDNTAKYRAGADAGARSSHWTFPQQPLLLVVGTAILIVIGAASVWLVVRWQSDTELSNHTFAVQSSLTRLLMVMGRTERSERGYLLNDDPVELDTFRQGMDELMPALANLVAVTADNPQRQKAMAALRSALAIMSDDMREVVRLHEQGDNAASLALLRQGRGHSSLDEARRIAWATMDEEQQVLAARTLESRRTSRGLLAIELIGTALVIGFAVLSSVMVRRANQERQAALRSLEATNAGLEEAIIERTAHLHEANDHLRQANEEIRRTADVLNNTIASMPDAVLVIDERGRILISNPAAEKLGGIRPNLDCVEWEQHYQRFLPDEVTPFPPHDTPFRRASRGEHVDNVEIVLRRPNETAAIHFVGHARPIRDASGELRGAVIVYRDITAAREVERQLRQAQKMDAVGQFTGGVAHDFNNILTVITGTIDILAKGVVNKPDLHAIATLIDRAAERGAELTRRLLAFARKQPLQPRQIDVNGLIVEAVKLLRPALGERVQIDSILEGDTWPALVDPSQLTTALINLALNARDAMPDGGRLTLESGNVVLDEDYAKLNGDVSPGAYVMIAVSDTGSGIPAAIRDRVFEPFFTTKGVGKGTGLGLSMVYGFVKQSGGHLKIDSEEGLGTTIKIYLPSSGEAAGRVTEALPTTHPQGGSETILVVEDDELVRGYVIAQLRSLGYDTLAAHNAADALAILEGGARIDLLFTDVVMPGGMTGRQLADEVGRRWPSIKVLYTSGYAENAIVHQGRLDAGVHLLAKPYRKTDLARMIRTALETAESGVPREPASAS